MSAVVWKCDVRAIQAQLTGEHLQQHKGWVPSQPCRGESVKRSEKRTFSFTMGTTSRASNSANVRSTRVHCLVDARLSAVTRTWAHFCKQTHTNTHLHDLSIIPTNTQTESLQELCLLQMFCPLVKRLCNVAHTNIIRSQHGHNRTAWLEYLGLCGKTASSQPLQQPAVTRVLCRQGSAVQADLGTGCLHFGGTCTG